MSRRGKGRSLGSNLSVNFLISFPGSPRELGNDGGQERWRTRSGSTGYWRVGKQMLGSGKSSMKRLRPDSNQVSIQFLCCFDKVNVRGKTL